MLLTAIAGPRRNVPNARVFLDLPSDQRVIITRVTRVENNQTVERTPVGTFELLEGDAVTVEASNAANRRLGTVPVVLRYQVPNKSLLEDTLLVTVIDNNLRIVPVLDFLAVGSSSTHWLYQQQQRLPAPVGWSTANVPAGQGNLRATCATPTPADGSCSVLGAAPSVAPNDVQLAGQVGNQSAVKQFSVVRIDDITTTDNPEAEGGVPKLGGKRGVKEHLLSGWMCCGDRHLTQEEVFDGKVRQEG